MSKIQISSSGELRRHLPQLHAAGIIATRLETTGSDPHTDKIRSIRFAIKGLPTMVLKAEIFSSEGVKLLQQIFSTSAVKVFHDAKADLQFLLAFGILPKPLLSNPFHCFAIFPRD